jgi:hypothetical protein
MTQAQRALQRPSDLTTIGLTAHRDIIIEYVEVPDITDGADHHAARKAMQDEIAAMSDELEMHSHWAAPALDAEKRLQPNNPVAAAMYDSAPCLKMWRERLVPTAIALTSLYEPESRTLPTGEPIDTTTRRFFMHSLAQKWLDGQVATVVGGRHVAPRDAQMTVEQWCTTWLEGYKINREGTVREARTHIRRVVAEFGTMQLSAVRPSHVKGWVAKLKEDYEPSYVYALHSRLAQIMSDAVHDDILGRNPCSKRTSPPMGKAKMYVVTTEQMWALHDAMPERSGGGSAGRVHRPAGQRSQRTAGFRCRIYEGCCSSEAAVARRSVEDDGQ